MNSNAYLHQKYVNCWRPPPLPPPPPEEKEKKKNQQCFHCFFCVSVLSLCDILNSGILAMLFGGGTVILSPLCEVLIEMVANSQSQSLTYSRSRLNWKGHTLCRNSSCDITILLLCLVDQCVCMAIVSDIMLDGLTKTMERLCTLVSELML